MCGRRQERPLGQQVNAHRTNGRDFCACWRAVPHRVGVSRTAACPVRTCHRGKGLRLYVRDALCAKATKRLSITGSAAHDQASNGRPRCQWMRRNFSPATSVRILPPQGPASAFRNSSKRPDHGADSATDDWHRTGGISTSRRKLQQRPDPKFRVHFPDRSKRQQ